MDRPECLGQVQLARLAQPRASWPAPAWTGPSGPQCLTQVQLARVPDILHCSRQMPNVGSTGTQPVHPHLRACTAVPLRLTTCHALRRGALGAAFIACGHWPGIPCPALLWREGKAACDKGTCMHVYIDVHAQHIRQCAGCVSTETAETLDGEQQRH